VIGRTDVRSLTPVAISAAHAKADGDGNATSRAGPTRRSISRSARWRCGCATTTGRRDSTRDAIALAEVPASDGPSGSVTAGAAADRCRRAGRAHTRCALDRVVPQRVPAALARRAGRLARARDRAGSCRSTTPPTLWSARRSPLPTTRATASRSIPTGRAAPGAGTRLRADPRDLQTTGLMWSSVAGCALPCGGMADRWGNRALPA